MADVAATGESGPTSLANLEARAEQLFIKSAERSIGFQEETKYEKDVEKTANKVQ